MESNFQKLWDERKTQLVAEITTELFSKIKEAATTGELDNEKMLSRQEVCAKLNISLTTLWKYVKQGRITEVKIGERKVLSRESDLISLVASEKPLKYAHYGSV